ncbi:adenylate/guanylate cyclase domain-containing protein [Desulfovibrio ferrophilus]|uniref:Family 3 adenylate cyclase n=1 Tax=Desulfovibrio ferrophilus TaxID=241368 RepID=A0A2Z6B2X6_9BACT|nr:adenylate/guanylate cyclase domain-containing protein [Desulfovibrio ferrophilus]BBD09869.1 family 3 adenylate cyclase [Desulfovibrio ferrophilus]
MIETLVIIDDEPNYVNNVFIPKLEDWDFNFKYVLISDFSYKKKLTENFSNALSIIQKSIESGDKIKSIFIDLALLESEQEKLLSYENNDKEELDFIPTGFKLANFLRKHLLTYPMIAFTQHQKTNVVSTGYSYDFDNMLDKTNLGNLKKSGFRGLIEIAEEKRNLLIESIPRYYKHLITREKPKNVFTTAYGQTFEHPYKAFEMSANSSTEISCLFEETQQSLIILFADLAESVSIKEDEGFHEGLFKCNKHNKIATEVIIRHNGTIVKYIGDCVMATFPINEPEQAILAAISIQEELLDTNNKYYLNSNHKIQSKISIAAGDVIFFYGNDPHGPIVDLAARLNSKAKAKEVLISESLSAMTNHTKLSSRYGLAKNWSVKEYLEPMNPHKFKGFKEKAQYFRINWIE